MKAAGYTPDDITDVFLTHLHFDHCGGSIRWNSARDGYEPVFRNATYWSNRAHWDWAVKPNAREKASFLKENILPIQESGQLKFVDLERGSDRENVWVKDLFPGFDVWTVNGHTDAMMIPHLRYKDRTLVYMADLLPDRQPMVSGILHTGALHGIAMAGVRALRPLAYRLGHDD